MKFGRAQNRMFSAEKGAYSRVTEREEYDSQITLTDYEAEILLSHFGKANVHIGKVQSGSEKSSKPFRLHPDGRVIRLNVVFPKPKKTELRLYLSTKAGFKPKANEIWFLYEKNKEMWIGSMSESDWRRGFSDLKQDESDQAYQDSLLDAKSVRTSKLKERDIYQRDRRIALERMELSGYVCEFDPKHRLFTAKATNKPYLEAHHLIPIALQEDFSDSLDTLTNVYCLCPHCHRAIHHAEDITAREILNTLVNRRNVLESYSLDISELHSFYAIEEIGG